IYRVQDAALVPPQGTPIIPSRYVGAHFEGREAAGLVEEGKQRLLVPEFFVRKTESSVELIHTPTKVSLTVDLTLSGTDRFASQLVGECLRGHRAEIRIVKPRSPPVLVRTRGGVLPIDIHIWEVDSLSEVPPQGRPLGPVGRELTSIPAEAQLTATEQIGMVALPLLISLIPTVGAIDMIADFVYGLRTGRDILFQQKLSTDAKVMLGVGALLGTVSLGFRGIGLIMRMTGRSRQSAMALAAAVRRLSPED